MKSFFDLDPAVTYLNCANVAPMMNRAREANLESLDLRANPWRMSKDDWFADSEILRYNVAEIFQTSVDNIAFMPSASYGLATAAKNMAFKSGKTIVVLDKQFPSNVYVWEHLVRRDDLKIVRVRKEEGVSLTDSVINALHDDVVLVALPNCHWMDGTWIDLEKVSRKVKEIHALLVLDLSQSLGAFPTEIDKIDPDFAVAAGYKWMMGPYGLGYMYIAPRWQQAWEPLEYSWMTRYKSDDFAKLTDYTALFKRGARKFDMGEYPMLNLRPMSVAAVRQVLNWGVSVIQSHVKSLTDIVKEHNRSQGFPVYENVGHIIGIPFGKRDPEKVKAALSAEKISVSYRDEIMRVSPHLYNDHNDIERLLKCLEKI